MNLFGELVMRVLIQGSSRKGSELLDTVNARNVGRL